MGLKVNFSKNEADSKPREIPPSGEYQCKITEIETREVKPGPSPHVGKPYWNVQYVIQTGQYAGNRLFSNIMLFEGKDGTLGSLAQFLKALGWEISAGEVELPEPDDLIGQDLNVRGTKHPAGYDNKAKRELGERFQVRGYKKANNVMAKANASSSMLP